MNKRIPNSFSWFIEQIITLSEVQEVPGIAEQRDNLLKQVWEQYPGECVALGLTDGLKKGNA